MHRFGFYCRMGRASVASSTDVPEDWAKVAVRNAAVKTSLIVLLEEKK